MWWAWGEGEKARRSRRQGGGGRRHKPRGRSYPRDVSRDACVHAGEAGLGATKPPADHTDEHHGRAGPIAHRGAKEGTARVALACVLPASLVPRAEHPLQDISRVAGSARLTPHHGHPHMVREPRQHAAAAGRAPTCHSEHLPDTGSPAVV